jgi:beta-xylosidase
MPKVLPAIAAFVALGLTACATDSGPAQAAGGTSSADAGAAARYLSQPIIPGMYTADPSAHVFRNRIYLYPSHDIDAGVPEDDLGSHFAMRDYHVFSMDRVGAPITDHGVALDIKDVPWAGRQMWAPDAAEKNGRYFLYFPAKDKQDVFRIGVAVSDRPEGPFKAQPAPIPGSFSIDPAVFRDGNEHYMVFGGIWGGQLQRWATGQWNPAGSNTDLGQPDRPALAPKIARMSADMLTFAEPPRDLVILDEAGQPLKGGDTNRRFFEGGWMHKHNGLYYFSYSTGDTHRIVYATSDKPYGPFTYRGVILEPVQGWTTHHSIVQHDGRWWLFYHDTQLSGKTHLRNVKVTELRYGPDGTIQPIRPMR